MIMEDEETQSLWSHITGEALEGKLKGRRLAMLPAVQTTWALWFEEHPDTKVLVKQKEIRSSRYESYFADPDRTGIFRSTWLRDRMPGKSIVLGLNDGPHALAVTEKKMNDAGVVNTTVGEKPVVVALLGDGGVHAYLSNAKNRILHFARLDKGREMQDRETNSIWDPGTGQCIKGELEGIFLEEIIVWRAYWFAWSGFYPNTIVVD